MTHGQLPPLPFPSVNVRPAIVILSVISLPVASAEAVGDPQQACALTPTLDASQAYANALEQSIHGDNADRQHHSHTANEIPNCHSDSPLVLIRQYLFVTMITAYLICKCAKYWAEARADSARRVSQARQVRRRCDHGVSSGAPISADDPAPLPEGEVHDGRNVRAPVSKGRQFSTVVARNHSSSIHASNASELLDRAASPSLIREDQDRRDKPNATNVNALGSSSSHILSGTAQVSFRSEPQPDPSWTPIETGLFSADSVTKRAWSLPEPAGTNHGQTPLRNPSLPHPNYVRMPPPSTKTNPLETTLYAGSKDLGPPPVIQWFILFIEVNLEDEDPEHNLHCFEEMIKQSAPESTSLYFESLASRDATPDKIKDKLTLLYLRAGWVSDDSLVFVFLTGTGDGTNRMCLRNGKVLTEEDIRGYISDVRTRSGLTNVQTVPVIFDICRVNKDVPGAEVCRVVDLMWSCSRGQQAHALGFDPKLHVPNSCFLLALFWAAYDVSISDSLDFEKAFRSRLGQLVRIRRYSHDYYLSESGECEQCGIGEKCTSPGPQDPEGQQVGWDAIASLGALIMARYPEYVRNVVTVLTGEMQHCEIWEATKAASSSSLQPDNLDQRMGCKEEHRGATQHVVAGSAKDLVS